MSYDVEYTQDGITIEKGKIFISWADIDQERNNIRFKDHVLVEIRRAGGRSADFDNAFIIPKESWEFWKPRLLKQTVHFGEIDGKHSDISIKITESDIKREISDIDAIADFYTRNGVSTGRVDYIGQYLDNVDCEYFEDDEAYQKGRW